MMFVREAPGHYVATSANALFANGVRWDIRREPTTFGIRRASNDLWTIYRNDVRWGARRKYLKRAQQDVLDHVEREGKGA